MGSKPPSAQRDPPLFEGQDFLYLHASNEAILQMKGHRFEGSHVTSFKDIGHTGFYFWQTNWEVAE
jgi:hypothetical protein